MNVDNDRNNILKQQKMQNQNIKYKNKATQVTEISKVYDLPTILTGYIIFELVGTTFLSRSNKQMINANFKTIEEKIKKQILIQSVTIPDIDLKLLYKETSNIPNEREKNKKNKKSNKKINKNKALKTSRNIYENLCKNEKLQKQFRDIFSCLNQKTKFINIDKMLGIKSFEYPHEICTKCKTNKLKRMARYQGKICVSYGNLEGPQIGRSFLKKCTKCNITFSYGDMETPNSKKRHRLQDLDYFQLSPFTYFKKDIFRSTEFHLLEIARGFEKKVQLYNIDHQHTIKEIQDQLELNKELLGIRLSTNCQLETNRLIDAFYLYTLQKELEEQCDITLSISKNEMLQIKKQKQQRINLHRKTSQTLSQSLSQEEQKNIGISDISIDHLDLFEFFYTKHQQDLSNIDHGILNSVPIDSDGNVCIGHFSVMMDGNQKNIRACCAYHEEDVFQGMKFYHRTSFNSKIT